MTHRPTGQNLVWSTKGSILGSLLFNIFICDLFFFIQILILQIMLMTAHLTSLKRN